jgi:hypothetical protein
VRHRACDQPGAGRAMPNAPWMAGPGDQRSKCLAMDGNDTPKKESMELATSRAQVRAMDGNGFANEGIALATSG